MTGSELMELLTPTVRLRLAKPIHVGDEQRFAAGEIVQARALFGSGFGDVRVWPDGTDEPKPSGGVRRRRFATAGLGDLAGAELADELDPLGETTGRVYGGAGTLSPREQAVAYLKRKIAAGEAGFDAYDRTIFLVALEDEQRPDLEEIPALLHLTETPSAIVDRRVVWARRYVVQAGELGFLADELGYDLADPPIVNTPLASRAAR